MSPNHLAVHLKLTQYCTSVLHLLTLPYFSLVLIHPVLDSSEVGAPLAEITYSWVLFCGHF